MQDPNYPVDAGNAEYGANREVPMTEINQQPSNGAAPANAGATVAPYPAKGFLVPGRTQTEDYAVLRRWNWWLMVLFLVQAIVILPLAAILARGSIPMDTNFSTFDPFRRIYVNQIQDRGYYQPGGEICVFLFIDAIYHLINAVSFNWWSRRAEAYGTDYLRWFFWSISTAWLVVIVSLLSGLHEILFIVPGVMIITSSYFWFFFCQEQTNGNVLNRQRTFWWPWLFAFAVWASLLIILWSYLFAYPFRGVEPTIVYPINIFTMFFLLMFWVIQGLQYGGVRGFGTFVSATKWYYALNFLFKTLLAWLMFAALVWLFYTVDSNIQTYD